MEQRQGVVNGLAFTWLEAGEQDAPLALCQHGFPDTPSGWRWLLPALADAGFHAIAPWARGYAPTAVPDSGASPIPAWVSDLCAFHEEFGHGEAATLIGHDWGALATYGAASFAPDRWGRIVAASVPPTSIMSARIAEYEQVKAFWYQYVFAQPTAEGIVANNDFEFIRRLWQEWSPGFDARDELPHVLDALSGPANLTAALSTYRSMMDLTLQPPELANELMAILSPHPQPTLYLHGADDRCVPNITEADILAVLPEGSRAEIVAGAGHFLQYEQPDRVVESIVAFVS